MRAMDHKVAIAYLTKDRINFTAQTLPLVAAEAESNFDLWWFDGSATAEGVQFPTNFLFHWRNEHEGKNPIHKVMMNVTGGSAQAIIAAWQALYHEGYEYIGLIENDVLLEPGWFKRCMEMFDEEITTQEKYSSPIANVTMSNTYKTGAVSARCFTDRIFEKRGNYAIMANVGAGMFLTRREFIGPLLENWHRYPLWIIQALCKYFTGYNYPIPKGIREQDPEMKKTWYLSEDWFFEVVLWSKGYHTLACVPSIAINLDDPDGKRDPVEK